MRVDLGGHRDCTVSGDFYLFLLIYCKRQTELGAVAQTCELSIWETREQSQACRDSANGCVSKEEGGRKGGQTKQ